LFDLILILKKIFFLRFLIILNALCVFFLVLFASCADANLN